MPTESITKEFVINDDQTFDILMKVIDEHKGRRKVIPSGRYEEGRRLLRELFLSEPEDLAIASVEWACLEEGPASKALKYKGYTGTIEHDAEDDLLFGHIVGISDSIGFHGSTMEEIEASFIDAVENYLSLCKEIGKLPDE